MNRRSFIRNILAAGASCSILPSALTYARKWKSIGLLDAGYTDGGVWHFETHIFRPAALSWKLYDIKTQRIISEWVPSK